MKKAIPLAMALCLVLAGTAPGSPDGEGGPPVAAPGKAPKIVVLSKLADAYGPVRFDHGAHADMASGCGDCHHHHGETKVRACGECHTLDPAAYRRSADLRKIRPCGECHPADLRPGDPARVPLKVAYHRACFRCHGREVGSVGEDPKGCTEMCHARRAPAR